MGKRRAKRVLGKRRAAGVKRAIALISAGFLILSPVVLAGENAGTFRLSDIETVGSTSSPSPNSTGTNESHEVMPKVDNVLKSNLKASDLAGAKERRLEEIPTETAEEETLPVTEEDRTSDDSGSQRSDLAETENPGESVPETLETEPESTAKAVIETTEETEPESTTEFVEETTDPDADFTGETEGETEEAVEEQKNIGFIVLPLLVVAFVALIGAYAAVKTGALEKFRKK